MMFLFQRDMTVGQNATRVYVGRCPMLLGLTTRCIRMSSIRRRLVIWQAKHDNGWIYSVA